MSDRAIPVFLDACVLYSPLVRGLILGAAEAGFLAPLWSPRVLDEWRIAVARKVGPDAVAEMEAAEAAMAARHPHAAVMARAPVEHTAMPDPNDAHVLAAAAAGGAEVLLTFNIRDFPARVLAPVRLTARHPDSLLWELYGGCAGAVLDRLIREALPGRDRAGRRAALKRARLPRLGKFHQGV